MAVFETGNRFWLNRSKHGRDKILSSPEFLLEESMKYFDWCTNNPLLEFDYRGKDIQEVQIPKMRAFTWSGLELYLGVDTLRKYKTQYPDFIQVVNILDKIITTQKFEGAAAGLLNPNIIARDLGLVDKQQQEASIVVTERPMTKEELKAQLDELNSII